MLPEILSSNIIPIPWSDHNAVYTTIASTIPKSHDSSWYLPDILLKNPSHRLIFDQALKEYLMHNTSPEISTLTLWEAHKPVLRGIFQRQSAMFKRERKILERKLDLEYNTAFVNFQNNPSSTTKTRLEKARLEYDLFLTENADKSLRPSRHAFFMNLTNRTLCWHVLLILGIKTI